MRNSMQFKKLVTSPKEFSQSIKNQSNKTKHGKFNSLFQLLHVNGKEVFQEQNNKKSNLNSSKTDNFIEVEQFVQKQIQGLKSRIKSYCQTLSTEFMRHSKIQRLNKQQKKCHENQIKQQEIMKIIYKKISCIVGQSNQDDSQYERIEKFQNRRGDYRRQNYQSQRNMLSEEQIQNVVQNLSNQKSLTIQITQGKVQNNVGMKLNLNKHNTHNFVNNLPISCSSTISQVLFKQAKTKPFSQFHKFCQKVLLDKKPYVSEINLQKSQQLQKTNSYLNQIYKKLHLLNTQLSNLAQAGQIMPMKRQIGFYENKKKNIGQEVDYICSILKKINQVHNIDSLFLNCQRPCCQFQSPKNSVQNKAKILLNLKQSAKKSIHYKTQATQNYFNRYYNHDKFDMSRVYSLAKTKNEQMQSLQKAYHKSRQKSKPCKKRSQSLYNHF